MGKCQETLTWTPYDGERGLYEAERTVACVLDDGHYAYHLGTDRMPFGPWRNEPDG